MRKEVVPAGKEIVTGERGGLLGKFGELGPLQRLAGDPHDIMLEMGETGLDLQVKLLHPLLLAQDLERLSNVVVPLDMQIRSSMCVHVL